MVGGRGCRYSVYSTRPHRVLWGFEQVDACLYAHQEPENKTLRPLRMPELESKKSRNLFPPVFCGTLKWRREAGMGAVSSVVSVVTQSCPTLCNPMDSNPLGGLVAKSYSTLVIPWTIACQAPFFPWDFPSKKTGVGCHFLLWGIFPTQGSNPALLHCRQAPALQADSLPNEPPGFSGKTVYLKFVRNCQTIFQSGYTILRS